MIVAWNSWLTRGVCVSVAAATLTLLAPCQSNAQIGAPRAISPRGALREQELATVNIFENVSPSVVYITTAQQVRDFFTRNIMRVPRGTGSGFVWDDQVHIVTNLHVIRGATEADVTLADQRTFPASLVGVSREHDLAVLKINITVSQPPPLPIGTSHDLRVGQDVLAIGNPFGLDHSLTTGVISALDRSIDGDQGATIEHLIQTDAAINPGNSGGPLIDSAGRLIGVNTAIYSPSGAYAGVGFAVPVDTINTVVPRLIAYGRYVRPGIGISANDAVSRRLLDSLDLDGVLVLGVAPDSPADQVQLRATRRTFGGSVVLGDIIRSVDDRPVKDYEEFVDLLDEYSIGDSVVIEVWRNGDIVKAEIQLAAF